jgi:hypothetical protein
MANAIYFADRIERGVSRGSGDPEDNSKGLTEAYAGMCDRRAAVSRRLGRSRRYWRG